MSALPPIANMMTEQLDFGFGSDSDFMPCRLYGRFSLKTEHRKLVAGMSPWGQKRLFEHLAEGRPLAERATQASDRHDWGPIRQVD
jgi:hypothetical protein